MSTPTHSASNHIARSGSPRAIFMTTRWAVVQAAGLPGPQRQDALGELVVQYQPAMKQYLRTRFGVDHETADDLVQGFLLDKVLRRNLIANAERKRGKFRTFLLTAINRYAIDSFRREGAQKRIPRDKLAALDETAEWEHHHHQLPGAEEFDNAFVRQVLASAIHRLREHCARRNQQDVWGAFYHRVLAPVLEIADPKPYRELVELLELDSEVEARNRLITAKRIFRRELKAVVEEYSDDSKEAETELLALRQLLA